MAVIRVAVRVDRTTILTYRPCTGHIVVIDVPGGLRCANGSKMLTARTSPWWYPAALRCSRFAPLYWSGLLQRQNRNAEDIAARSSRRLTGNISHRIVAPGSLPGIAALF